MKKTRGFKARRQTILIGAMVLLTIFLTNFVSSFEFDNVKNYNSTTKTVTIVNAFGLPVIGTEIVKIKLNTPTMVKTGYGGIFKVAEFEITSLEDYSDVFDGIEFYDVNNGMNEIERIYEYKVKGLENYSVNDYKKECSLLENKTQVCKYILSGTHEEQREVWTPLGRTDFLSGEVITIGIFTYVNRNDYIEWIPTFYGVKINEWATWVGGLNNGLVTYYKLDETTGAVKDEKNLNNGTSNGLTRGVTGKIVNAYNFTGGTQAVYKNNPVGLNGVGLSGTMWVYLYKIETSKAFLFIDGLNDESLDFGISGTNLNLNLWDTGGSGVLNVDYSPYDDKWTFLYWEVNATDIRFYIDGDYKGTGIASFSLFSAGTQNLTIGDIFFGGRTPLAIIDEVGIWNRTLTDTEISDLYNSGKGCAYGLNDCGTLPTPSVTLNSPTNYQNFTIPQITFNTTATDTQKVNNVTLYIDGVVNETDTSNVNGTYLFNKTLGEGKHNWSILAYNNNSKSNQSSTFDLWINTTPSVTLTAPVNYANLTYNSIWFNSSVLSVYNIQNVSLYINGSLNSTNTSGINGTYKFNVNIGDGFYNWSILSCSSLNACNQSSTRFLTVDSTPPTIFISSGNGTQTFGQLATNHTVNYTITDLNLYTCTLQYNGVNKTISCTSGLLNSTNFVLTYGIYNAIIYANDSVGFVTSYSFNWSYEFFYLSESYTSSLLEGTNNTFKINLVSSNALTIGNLSYNGTSNIGVINSSGNNYTITKSMISPLVSTDSNLSFFWNIIKSNGISYAFESHNQTVLNFNIDNCSVNTINILNFSIKDEESQANLNATGDNVSIKIDLTLSTISGTTITTLYRLYNQSTPAPVCINSSLGTSSYLIDALVEYQASNYAHEFYNIQKYNLNGTINPLQNITLYDILSADNQPFRITYRDKSYLPVSNALVQINRKYVEEGIFKIVEVPKTDSYGETVGNLVVNNVIYTFNIVKDGVLLDSFPNVRVVCQTPTISDCKLDLNSFSSTSTIFNFTDDNDFSYTLITNRTLRTTTALFTIPSGNISTIVLNVSTTDALGTSICSQSITTSGSSSLICTYPAPIGNVSLVAKLYRDGVLVGSGNINLNPSPKDMFNGFSVILALFVLLTLIGVSISDSPITMVILFMVGVILLTALNLVANTGFVFGATILYLIIAIVLIIIKGAKRQI